MPMPIQFRREPNISRPELDAVLQEIHQNDQTSPSSIAISVLTIVLHLVAGTLFFYYIEGFTLYNSVYFCIVTMTTVGYGDIVPTTNLSKMFVVFYIILSIVVLSTVIANMADSLIEHHENLIVAVFFRTDSRDGVQSSIINPHTQSNPHLNDRSAPIARIMNATAALSSSDYCALGITTVYLVTMLVVGVFLFMSFEGCSFVDAAYATVISAATVGYGDIVPRRPLTKVVMMVWLVWSTVLLIKAIAEFADARGKALQRAVYRRMLTARCDSTTLDAMDTDRDGRVDKAEFLSEVLVQSGKVEREDVLAILARFEQLDLQQTGYVDLQDLSLQV